MSTETCKSTESLIATTTIAILSLPQNEEKYILRENLTAFGKNCYFLAQLKGYQPTTNSYSTMDTVFKKHVTAISLDLVLKDLM